MLSKLDNLEEKYNELTDLLSKPETIADQQKYQRLAKAHANLAEIVDKYRQYKSISKQLQEVQGAVEGGAG